MSLLRFPQTLPNTGGIQWLLGAEGPTRVGPTVAPLPLGISVDTGTLERVANWSPDSVATVDPCDPCSAFDATAKRLTQAGAQRRKTPRSSSDGVFLCKSGSMLTRQKGTRVKLCAHSPARRAGSL